MAALRQTARDFAADGPEALREGFDSLANPMSGLFRKVKREPTRDFGVPATWFVPRTWHRTMLYLHGGAYVFGSARSHAELVAAIALAAEARVLVPEYRLAPEHPFPAALDDVQATYVALTEREADPQRIVVSGDSAGGGLSLALMLRLRSLGRPLPAGAALICPWVDLTATGGSLEANGAYDWMTEADGRPWIGAYLAGHDPKDPLASPLFADLAGLPPLLVQAGEAELLHDQIALFAARAKEAGIDVRHSVERDMVHNWHSFAGPFPRCRPAIDQIGAFAAEVTTVIS
jgi:acetyl esterase/lipase